MSLMCPWNKSWLVWQSNVFTFFRNFRPRLPYLKKPARRRTILWRNWVKKFEICAMQSLLLLLTIYLRSKHLDPLRKTSWSYRLRERKGDRKLKENLRSVIGIFLLGVYCEILSYEKDSGWLRVSSDHIEGEVRVGDKGLLGCPGWLGWVWYPGWLGWL